MKDVSVQILSDVTVHMKYARFLKELNRRETWKDIVDRNMGMHIRKFPTLRDDIEKAYKFVYDKKVLPSMRSLQFAGKPIEISPNRIFNCAFLHIDDIRAFSEIMFLLLGGTGMGYSVQRHHIEKLPPIKKPRTDRKRRYLIGDSIEGWADSIKVLMRSYFEGTAELDYDYSDIRDKGVPLITSGGKAPGPQPLKDCIHNIRKILDQKDDGDKLTPIEAHDIICYIADSVLAGGIRRAALIALFSFDDEEMISCKYSNFWELNPHRSRANNSATLLRPKITKDSFMDLWTKIRISGTGEPGIYLTNDKDWGANPCVEIALRHAQFCNLCEINVSDVESQEDLNERARAAAFIGTLQASYTNFHYLRDVWRRTTEKEALIGIGMTGIASGRVLSLDLEQSANVVKEENARVATLIGINQAARTTTIKPSGTTSCVLACSSGIHAWHSKYYIRSVRVGKNESIYNYLAQNHPELVEDELFSPTTQAVIRVPQKAPEGSILREDESAVDLLERVKKFHTEWIKAGHRSGKNTHNVSATISLKDEEWDEVGEWIWENKNSYAGLSFLPFDGGNYIQAPFETIDEQRYNELIGSLKEIDLSNIVELKDDTSLNDQVACAGGACELR